MTEKPLLMVDRLEILDIIIFNQLSTLEYGRVRCMCNTVDEKVASI